MNGSDHLTSLDRLAYVPRLQFRQVLYVDRPSNCQWTAVTNRCDGSVAITTMGDVGSIGSLSAHDRETVCLIVSTSINHHKGAKAPN